MQRNPLTLLLSVVALVLGLGLLFSGCGRNVAQDNEMNAVSAEDAAAAAEQAVLLEEREAALGQRGEELARLEQSLENRVEFLQERLAQVEAREAAVVELENILLEQEPVPLDADVSAERADSAPERPQVEPAPQPPIVMLRLPAATELALELHDALSSESSLVGDPVRAVLLEDVARDGRIAIPAGSAVRGSVVDVTPQKKIGGQARLSVRFDEIETPVGYRVAIQAFLEAAGEPQKKKDAATIGGSAAGGAVLGRILSKNNKTKGTVIGGILGAAIGTAVARENQGDPVALEPGTPVVIALDLPVHVAIAETTEAPIVASN